MLASTMLAMHMLANASTMLASSMLANASSMLANASSMLNCALRRFCIKIIT